MIQQKPLLKLLSLFLIFSLATPNFSYANLTCAELYQNKNVFFTPERKKKYLKLAITIPLTAAIGTMVWKKIDEKYFWPQVESKVTAQAVSQAELNAKIYDNYINNDFRFKRIKNATLDKEAANADSRLESLDSQKRMLAYNLEQNYLMYYQKYREIKKPSQLTLEENMELFGTNPLFIHLNFFFENGVKQFEGTTVEEKHLGPLSDGQKNTLFQLTHELYTKYALIDLTFNKNNKEVLDRSILAKNIYNDSYTQKLLELRKQNKISPSELVYYVQEDAHHNYYFSIFETLHIVNLKTENGQYINKPLTLLDLRADRLETLNSAQKKRR